MASSFEKRVTALEEKSGCNAVVFCVVNSEEARINSEAGRTVILVATGIDRAPHDMNR